MNGLGPDFADRYRIESKIGQGGMGVVYKAIDLKLERPVALKVLADSAAEQPTARSRFLKEISLTASLNHPYIVPVYEGGIEEDRFYFTMELIEGSDLHQICDSSAIDPERAVRLLRQVCEALRFIHQAGHVHRDVKPTNVLVWEPGHEWESAKLADFGIARTLAEDSQLTKAPPGSPAYMPPEAVEWQPQTALSDQYSLGVMAFELLCGSRPFGDDEVPKAHCDKPVPQLRDKVESLPPALCAAVERALAKDPAERFPDIATFSAALAPDPKAVVAIEAPVGVLKPGSVPLADEIATVIADRGGWVQIEEIAREINDSGRYRHPSGEVSAAEIDRRTRTFAQRFRRRGAAVRLR